MLFKQCNAVKFNFSERFFRNCSHFVWLTRGDGGRFVTPGVFVGGFFLAHTDPALERNVERAIAEGRNRILKSLWPMCIIVSKSFPF